MLYWTIGKTKKVSNKKSDNVLDEWILARLNETAREVTKSLDKYDTVIAIGHIRLFVDDLSTWYIRRSRERVGPRVENNADKNDFYATTYTVLTTICKVIAPITPFLAEEIYKNLTGEESVHLNDWPQSYTNVDETINTKMDVVRKIVEVALSKRKEAQIRVRQPLASLEIRSGVSSLPDQMIQLILNEVNVKKMIFNTNSKALEINVVEEVGKYQLFI